MKNEITAMWKAVCKVLGNSLGQIFAPHLSYLALGLLLFTSLASARTKTARTTYYKSRG